TLRERGHADRFARAVRQRDRASDELVGLARVDAEPERDLDGLVEPGIGESLEGPDRVDRRVLASAIGQLGCLHVPFALAAHAPTTSTPMLRAVPARIFIAASTSFALRSTIFCSAIRRS